MAEPRVLGYLKSLYPYASDTFVRWEVRELRALGYTVVPFSVRKPPSDLAVSLEIAEEQQRTEFLLDGGKRRLLLAGLLMFIQSPLRWISAYRLAMRTSAPGLKGRVRQLAYLVEACLLVKLMREKGVRHLHNHIGANSASVAMLASHLSGIPYSLTIHGPKEFDQPQQLALGEKIHRAAFVVAISEYGRSQLMRWCDHTQWDKIHIVHCGVDEMFLNLTPTPVPEALRFVCVGRLCEEKGHLVLIEAMRRLAARGLRPGMTLVGDGPFRETIEQLVRQYDLEELVRITGWMSSVQVRQEVLAARAMVLPSLAEGLPVVIMEALALHRPVISTYIAGIPELVEPGVCGWLVPAGSVEALADAMAQALEAPAEALQKMGRAGAERVAERHDVKKETRRLAELFRRYAGAEAAPADMQQESSASAVRQAHQSHA